MKMSPVTGLISAAILYGAGVLLNYHVWGSVIVVLCLLLFGLYNAWKHKV